MTVYLCNVCVVQGRWSRFCNAQSRYLLNLIYVVGLKDGLSAKPRLEEDEGEERSGGSLK